MMIFYISNVLKAGVFSFRNPWKAITFLALLFTSGLYGILAGLLINQVSNEGDELLSAGMLINYIFTAIALLTMIRMIFPVYKPQSRSFPAYFPLAKLQQYNFSIISDLFRPYFFYIALFLLTTYFFLDSNKLHFLLSGIIVLISSHLIRRTLHYLIDFRLKEYGYIIIAAIIIITGLGLSLGPDLIEYSGLNGIIVLASLFAGGYILETSIIESRIKVSKSSFNKGSIYLKLLLRNPNVKLYLLVGYLLKVIVLVVEYIYVTTKGEHFLDENPILWMFIPPLIMFTYVFNNTWGFWKNLWLNFELRSGNYFALLKQSLKIMLIPLLFDIVITLPVLLISFDEKMFILAFYFASTIFLILFSFLWSSMTPVLIRTTFQMKGSTAAISSFVTMGGIMLLLLLQLNKWFYLLIPFYMIAAGVALWYSISTYKDHKYILMKKLFKG